MYESAPGPDNSLPLARLLAALRQTPAGLVTDVDGTISAIVPRPADARVLPAARHALRRLAGTLALVAVVSGRSAADAERMVALPGLVYVGNHGLETLSGRAIETAPEARPWLPVVADAVRYLNAQLASSGAIVEAKGASASVHYRGLPGPETARRQVLEAVRACADETGLYFEEGRMVVNLLPPVAIDKGSAVRRLADERQLAGLAYLGDDLTDAHAFAALRRMRDERRRATLSVAVVGPETPERVRELADAAVGSVVEVGDLLQAVADLLEADAT